MDFICAVDPSLSLETAYTAAVGTPLQDTLCPWGDEDYWRLEVSHPEKLLLVDVVYDKLANMRLSLEWWRPKGLCVPVAPDPCSHNSDCSTGQTCDASRGGCRATFAVECFYNDHCDDAATTCSVVNDKDSRALNEPSSASASRHRVVGNLPAALAGDYYFKIFDRTHSVADPNIKYTFEIDLRDEPDTFEPNNWPHMATVIAPSTQLLAFLSYVDDVDVYRVTPEFASEAVIDIELRWPLGAQVQPTFEIVQQGWTFLSTQVRDVGAGPTAAKARRARVVAPSNAPIEIHVFDPEHRFDALNAYTLTVEVFDDPSEPMVGTESGRDDTPGTANVFAAGEPSASNSQSFVGTLVAQNDVDWYRIAKSDAENSLIHMVLDTPEPTDDFLLQLLTFQPTLEPCNDFGLCSGVNQCDVSNNICLRPWVQRPNPDGPGDPQVGGLTPNYIETQLPLYDSLYLMVRHMQSNSLGIVGYGERNYQLTVTHKEEPELIERTDPDNVYVVRPGLANLSKADFLAYHRPVAAPAITPAAGSGRFASIAPGSFAVAGSGCFDLPTTVYTPLGAVASAAAHITLSNSSTGVFVDDCGTANPVASASITGAGSVAYIPPAVVDLTHTVSLAIDGNTLAYHLPIVASSAVNPLLVTNAAGGAPSFGVAIDTSSPRFRIAPQMPTGMALTLELAASHGAVIGCYSDGSTPCPAPVANPCPNSVESGLSNCSVQAAGGTHYDILLGPTALGPFTVSVSSPLGEVLPTTFAVAGYTPSQLLSTVVRGMISYEGDQDFFIIPASGFPGAAMTITLAAPAGPVDVRMTAQRGSQAGSAGIAPTSSADVCSSGSCPNSSVCDHRNQCSQHPINQKVGAPEQCIYAYQDGDIEIWVNDVNANDWSDSSEYEITITLDEGCPLSCPTFVCALGN